MTDLFQIPYDDFCKRSKRALTSVDPRTAQKLKDKIDNMIKTYACLQDNTNYTQLAALHPHHGHANNVNTLNHGGQGNQSIDKSLDKSLDKNLDKSHDNKDYGRWQKYQSLMEPKQRHMQNLRGPHQHNFNNNRRQQFSGGTRRGNGHMIYRFNDSNALIDTRRRPKIGGGNDFHRQVLALLNKISPQNFERIKGKIAFLCDNEDNTEVIIFHILKKAHKDYGFVKLYMSLLFAIPKEFTFLIHKTSNVILTTFLQTLPEIIEELTKNIEGENNLSKFIKAKKDIYDINKTLCTLMIFGFIDKTDPITYLHTIKDLFDGLCKDNHEIYDIFIHFLYDFFSIHTSMEIKNASQPMITDLFDQRHDGICSKKTNFKWLDLIKFFQPPF